MVNTIGFLELNSIAKGVEVADIVLKTAAVNLVFSKAGCPGKYYLLFTGEVAAVQASLDAGHTIGGSHVVDSCIIPRIHPQVIKAINMTAMPEEMRAVGVMEFFSVTASVYGADAAVKTANVDLIEVRLGTGIGGGLIVNGKLFTGFANSGMEVGHMIIHPNGPRCACGRRGCLEYYASATGMRRMGILTVLTIRPFLLST